MSESFITFDQVDAWWSCAEDDRHALALPMMCAPNQQQNLQLHHNDQAACTSGAYQQIGAVTCGGLEHVNFSFCVVNWPSELARQCGGFPWSQPSSQAAQLRLATGSSTSTIPAQPSPLDDRPGDDDQASMTAAAAAAEHGDCVCMPSTSLSAEAQAQAASAVAGSTPSGEGGGQSSSVHSDVLLPGVQTTSSPALAPAAAAAVSTTATGSAANAAAAIGHHATIPRSVPQVGGHVSSSDELSVKVMLDLVRVPNLNLRTLKWVCCEGAVDDRCVCRDATAINSQRTVTHA